MTSTRPSPPPPSSPNGAPVAGLLTTRNPATGALNASVAACSPEQAAALVGRARAAQPAWEGIGFDGRARVLRSLRGWLARHLDELLETLTSEGGRTREDALFGECYYVGDALGFWARHAEGYLADVRIRPRSPLGIGRRIHVAHRPRGVVGVIAPWNFPLALGFGDAIPALMAGNTVVLKPSSATPLSSLLVERAWRESGAPADVLLVAAGRGEAGAALVDAADMIMFTGSAGTGRAIARRAAERLIPVSLELGGKDPMIVLADADLERAADVATRFAFWHSGQLCMSVERVYVEAPVHDAFVTKVVERVLRLRQGPGAAPGTAEVGAMVTAEQLEVVEAHVADAVAKGARVLAGGARGPGPGRFYAPTVLTGVDHGMVVMTEETFGPVLPIMAVADAGEALRLANDSRYGLNSSIFTRDLERGARLAAAVEAGNTCVNDAVVNAGIAAAPFGAAKESGLGARNGPEGIRKYCRSHTVLVTRRQLPAPLAWPASPGVTRAVERTLRLVWGRYPGRPGRRRARGRTTTSDRLR